jgi:hypothetical protein
MDVYLLPFDTEPGTSVHRVSPLAGSNDGAGISKGTDLVGIDRVFVVEPEVPVRVRPLRSLGTRATEGNRDYPWHFCEPVREPLHELTIPSLPRSRSHGHVASVTKRHSGPGEKIPCMIRDIEIAALMQEPIAESQEHLDRNRVASYTHHLDDAHPVTVFDTGDALILADGYHRVEAAQQLGRTTIKAEVRRGSRSDAMRFAVVLNKKQRGMTRSETLSAIKKRAGGRWAIGK